MSVNCNLDEKQNLTFIIGYMRLKQGASSRLVGRYFKNNLGGGLWELTEQGKLVPDPRNGLPLLELAQRALKNRETLPFTKFKPVLSRVNEQTYRAKVQNVEGKFVNIGGQKFYVDLDPKKWYEYQNGDTSWDIMGEPTALTAKVRVNGYKKDGTPHLDKNGDPLRKGSAVIIVDAVKWEEKGLANALQDLIEHRTKAGEGMDKTATVKLARILQDQALNYRANPEARTNAKILNRNKEVTKKDSIVETEPVADTELATEEVFDSSAWDRTSEPTPEELEAYRTEEYYHEEDYTDIPEPRERQPGEDDDLDVSKPTEPPDDKGPNSGGRTYDPADAVLGAAGHEVPPEIITNPWDSYLDPNKNPHITQHKIDAVDDGRHGESKSWRYDAYIDTATGKRVLYYLDKDDVWNITDASDTKYNPKGLLVVGKLKWQKVEGSPREAIYKLLGGSSIKEAQAKIDAKELVNKQKAWAEEYRYQQEYHPETLSDWESKFPKPGTETRLTPDEVSTKAKTLTNTPALAGYKEYIKALKDIASAQRALAHMLQTHDTFTQVYAQAVKELEAGGITPETFNKLLNGGCK